MHVLLPVIDYAKCRLRMSSNDSAAPGLLSSSRYHVGIGLRIQQSSSSSQQKRRFGGLFFLRAANMTRALAALCIPYTSHFNGTQFFSLCVSLELFRYLGLHRVLCTKENLEAHLDARFCLSALQNVQGLFVFRFGDASLCCMRFLCFGFVNKTPSSSLVRSASPGADFRKRSVKTRDHHWSSSGRSCFSTLVVTRCTTEDASLHLDVNENLR